MRLPLLIVWCLLLACVCAAAPADLLQPYLKTYCNDCHGAKKQKGDRRFDQLTGDFTQLAEAEAFQEILDQINLAQISIPLHEILGGAISRWDD